MTDNAQTENALHLSDYDYELPADLIAQQPIEPREAARLMMINKTTGSISHGHFFDLPKILSKNDVLVFNDSKVIPARLIGQKETGGQMEIFLLKKVSGKSFLGIFAKETVWQCLIKGKIKPHQKIIISAKIVAEPKEKIDDKIWLVNFRASDKKLFASGQTPLPPYIKLQSKPEDYQTVFAKSRGSVAAPTAGLHFSSKLMNELKAKGVQMEYVTLHVGLGTFASVETENIKEHKMHSELALIDSRTAARLNAAKKSGKRIIAVGTTAARTLESLENGGTIKAGSIETDIFIYQGYSFKFVDALITNFHLPKSTLLMLVSALAGKGLMEKAYAEAIKKRYKFFSFGDGMLIE